MTATKHLFATGVLHTTPGVVSTIDPDEAMAAIERHAEGDWGDCCAEDAKANAVLLFGEPVGVTH